MCDENLKRNANHSQLEDGDTSKPAKMQKIDESSDTHADLTEKISSLEEKLNNYELGEDQI